MDETPASDIEQSYDDFERIEALFGAALDEKPQRYVERFGRANYDVMLADCLWHVYRMIGKLGTRVYVARNGAA